VEVETRYARSGDVSVAYQVVGDGPCDLVLVPGGISHVEAIWDEPAHARSLRRLASFSRLILFDKRGTGLSDPVATCPMLETRMDDVRAVMDAAGSERATVLGVSEGGPMSALFAATYPERTTALILYGTCPTLAWDWDEGCACRVSPLELQAQIGGLIDQWGEAAALDLLAPSVVDDEHFRRFWARYERLGASPAMARALTEMNREIDVRAVLPMIRVPTLVVHRAGDRVTKPVGGRESARLVPAARYVELPGADHLPFVGDTEPLLDAIEEFMTGAAPVREPDRVLATVAFTDIVGSTERAASLGDRRWSELLESHHIVMQRELERFRGRVVDTAGDGFFATFDGPARAIRCVCAARDALRGFGLEIRAGLHTGEVEVVGDRVRGLAVHIGARVGSRADAGEVLVSSTVKDLVIGSEMRFIDRGSHVLKGVPGEWRLYAVGP
jgi:pimeloyl-ACP methyl ester carboxylesterase